MGKSGLEERMAKVEGMLEQVGKRIGSVENRLNHLETWFRWVLGILITVGNHNFSNTPQIKGGEIHGNES